MTNITKKFEVIRTGDSFRLSGDEVALFGVLNKDGELIHIFDNDEIKFGRDIISSTTTFVKWSRKTCNRVKQSSKNYGDIVISIFNHEKGCSEQVDLSSVADSLVKVKINKKDLEYPYSTDMYVSGFDTFEELRDSLNEILENKDLIKTKIDGDRLSYTLKYYHHPKILLVQYIKQLENESKVRKEEEHKINMISSMIDGLSDDEINLLKNNVLNKI